jgi:putative Mn2+ efflux pump MntP
MLAVALGCDAFSVAVCVGMTGATARQKLRLALGFGIFQFIMPIGGLAFGTLIGAAANSIAAYIGGGILIILGFIIIRRAFKQDIQCPPFIHVSTWALITASIGVSIDAFAVGAAYKMSAKNMHILPASIVIGIVAFLMTIIGAEVGGQIGRTLQHRAPLVGGIILIAIGTTAILGKL